MKKAELTRRAFLALTGGAFVIPNVIPATAIGRGGRPAPSDRIVTATIGWGWQGSINARDMMNQPDCQMVAVCDVDERHLQAGIEAINKFYGNQDCKGYKDYRELLARSDIDAVMIAVPDHWHALIAIEAANQKKDIYGEKPLARTIAEQQAIVRAVQANGVIWQTGSWQRSVANFHKAAEIVRNGLIGKVMRVEVGLPAGHTDFAGTKEKRTITSPPKELNYEMWIGPAQMQPYIEARVHKNWRWNYNTGGGQLLDWIGHHCDIAHWGLGFDLMGPYEVEAFGEFPPENAIWNTCTKYWIVARYPNNVEMIIAGGHPQIRSGVKWIGTDGWVWVDRGGFEASNPEWRDWRELPDELRKIPLYRSRNHMRNFFDCIKSRQPTITPVEVAHHSAIPGHLGLISMLVGHKQPLKEPYTPNPYDDVPTFEMIGRKLRWDAGKEEIIGDAEASAYLSRSYRLPWYLPKL